MAILSGILILLAWIGLGVVFHMAFLALGLRFEERGSGSPQAGSGRAPRRPSSPAPEPLPAAFFEDQGRGFLGF